jgi:hypothetical protein
MMMIVITEKGETSFGKHQQQIEWLILSRNSSRLCDKITFLGIDKNINKRVFKEPKWFEECSWKKERKILMHEQPHIHTKRAISINLLLFFFRF